MFKEIDDIVLEISSLPGITKKSAEKLVYYLISNKFKLEKLTDSIWNIKNIYECKECNFVTLEKLCYICIDKTRKNKLIIVENKLDIIKFEKMKNLNAYYHVIGNLISPNKKDKNLKNIDFEGLDKRIKNNKYSEIIIALSPNIEGLVTANYIKRKYSESNITQLAQGIPLGAAIDYVDEITLKKSIENRKGD